jgi:Holliday junction resolvase
MSYRKGRNLEYHVAAMLRRGGFTVTRAAGSHSIWDLIAYDEKTCLHVQVKARATSRDVAQLRQEVRRTLPPGCLAYLVTRGKRKTIWINLRDATA